MVTRRTIKANRIDATTGDTGLVANLGGTLVNPAGSLTLAAGATLTLGATATGLTAGGGAVIVSGLTGDSVYGSGKLTIDASLGELALLEGHQLVAPGVPKIREVTVPFTDFTEAATTDFFDYTVDATFDFVVMNLLVRKGTAFTGGTVTAVEMLVGDAADDDAYIATGRIDLISGSGYRGDLVADRGAAIATFGSLKIQNANTIRVTLNTTGGNCADLTAGECYMYVQHYTLP